MSNKSKNNSTLPFERAAGLLYGPYDQLLDHICPLCLELDIPCVFTEKEIYEKALLFYPLKQTYLIPYQELPFFLLQNFDVVFSCMSHWLFQEIMFLAQATTQKQLPNIWCPHGYSDKGMASFLATFLQEEKYLISYGQKMSLFLRKNLPSSAKIYEVGNYRLKHFCKYEQFYEDKLFSYCPSLTTSLKKKVLFAPTWDEASSTEEILSLLEGLFSYAEDHYELYVKLHPRLLRKDPIEIETFIHKHNKQLFIHDLPLIYPLLRYIDLYVGDTSSIGYDVLSNPRPMIFLNHPKQQNKDPLELELYTCGKVVDIHCVKQLHNSIYQQLTQENFLDFSVQKKAYHSIFTTGLTPEPLLFHPDFESVI